MRFSDLAVIPAVMLLASCGSGSGENGGEPVPAPPASGSGTPVLEDPSIEPPVSQPETPVMEETPVIPADTSSGSDPMTRNPVRVTVDITVPAHSSSELRVLVFRGGQVLTAEWIGDEFWTATGDFAADEEGTLRVEFQDRSGDITLGSVEKPFRTGSDSSESRTIGADEFDTARWDDDEDGTSNIDELRRGTDPLVADGPEGEPAFKTLYFTITVPRIVSDELRVRLSWDDLVFDADWQGDELWTAESDRFRIGSFSSLLVEFHDRNGALKLGSVRQPLSVYASQPAQIVIDDGFDTRSWDDDGDGRSNFDEVRAGTDPLVADEGRPPAALIERFDFPPGLDTWDPVLETRFMALDLPASFSERIVDEGTYSSRVTDIDYDFSADGDGTHDSVSTFEIEGDEGSVSVLNATRSTDGNSVSWTGTGSYRESYVLDRVYAITSTLDGDALVQRGRGSLSTGQEGEEYRAVEEYEYDVVLDLDTIDADNRCLASSGNITHTRNRSGEPPVLTSATRDSAEERWVVAGVDRASFTRYPDPTEADSLSTRFHCTFGIDR